MNGNYTLIYTILLILIPCSITDKTAEIRSGLLFIKDIEHQVIINPSYHTFIRRINLKDLDTTVQLAQDTLASYRQFCDTIHEALANDTKKALRTKQQKFSISTLTYEINDAPKVCARMSNSLPEIRTEEDKIELYNMALETKTENIYAGLFYDTDDKVFKFSSDHTLAPALYEKIMWDDEKGAENIRYIDSKDVPYSPKNFYTYKLLQPIKAYGLVLERNKVPRTRIICMRDVADVQTRVAQESQNKFLLQITAAICSKDYNLVKHFTDMITTETNYFKPRANIDIQSDEPIVQTHNTIMDSGDNTNNECIDKQCQHCGIIDSIIAETKHNTTQYKLKIYKDIKQYLHHTIRTKNPHQIQNKLIHLADYFECLIYSDKDITVSDLLEAPDMKTQNKYLIQIEESLKMPAKSRKKRLIELVFSVPQAIYTNNAIKEIREKINTTDKILKTHNEAINAINVNQETIQHSYNRLLTEIQHMTNISRINEFAIATLMSELDIKNTMTNLYNAVQFSLLKLADAMSQAVHGKVSPYVLAERDLDMIVTSYGKKNIHLLNNIDKVNIALIKTEDEYVFVLSIPLTNNKNTFKLYQVRPIPLFEEDKTIELIPDSEYIGISTDTTSFIKLSIHEYESCVNRDMCTTATPIETINEQNGCAAYSYRTMQVQCPAKPIPKTTKPFFATYGNNTYFSTPKQYIVNVICPNENSQVIKEPTLGTKALSNTGMFTLNAHCFVETQDNRRIITQSKPDYADDLGVSTINQALKYYAKPLVFDKPINITSNQIMDLQPMQLEPVPILTFSDILADAITPTQVASHVLRDVIIVFAVLISFALLTCISPRVRAWFKACCFVSNPVKYWSHYKKYNITGFDVTDKAATLIDRITPVKLKERYKKYQYRQREQQVQNTQAEIQQIINNGRSACEEQVRVITSPILQNRSPIRVPTAPTPISPTLTPSPANNSQKLKVHWQDTNF